MKKILLIGAGRSTPSFIRYFGTVHAENILLTIADREESLARERCVYPNTQPLQLDISDSEAMDRAICNADIVVSMLPPELHLRIAECCIYRKRSLVTASYMSKEIEGLHNKAVEAGVCILNETGLDPGIDHMSAMGMLDQLRSEGVEITEFESFTGGLPAPQSENNPWKYKFTWNPRNVVLAGQGGAVKFIQEGQYKYIPYHKIFRRTEIVEIPEYGKFEGYANRDSLKYREVYGLENVKTMYRGTLRRPGFCRSWNCFVELGATDDSFVLENSENMTYRDFINTFLAYHPTDSVELKLRQYLKIDQDDVDLWERLLWLGIFEQQPIGLKQATPAAILQQLLEEKWKMQEDDLDMIVMWHKIVGLRNGLKETHNSSMVCIGEDRQFTAMANTVGLPLAMATLLLIQGKTQLKGCHLPVRAEIYVPVLHALKEYGIAFRAF